MRRPRPAALVAGGTCVAALVGVVWSLRSSGEPLRCAPGMVALGPRCCATGQHLADGRCTGQPAGCRAPLELRSNGCVAAAARVTIPGGRLDIGPSDWEAQGVVTARQVDVLAFEIDVFEVTEDRWSGCVATGACPALSISGEPGRSMVGATLDEAGRFCTWARGRLPTPDELAWAAAGAGGRRYAWGDTGAVCRRAAWGLREGPCASGATGPDIAGAHPDGASPEGVHDLAGNVAEWAVAAGGAVVEVRGGSWSDGSAASLRTWARRVVAPSARAPDVGWRCVYPGAQGPGGPEVQGADEAGAGR